MKGVLTMSTKTNIAALLAQYAAACEYPSTLAESDVEQALGDYLAALGETRQIVRIRRGWELDQLPALHTLIEAAALATSNALATSKTVAALDASAARHASASLATSNVIAASDASAALSARAARDALSARAALSASAARDALSARDALAASAASAARAALSARAARDALSARDASDALSALDAISASDARAALAARAALSARAARDALYALAARDALKTSERDALHRLAEWYCWRRIYWDNGWNIDQLATVYIGATQNNSLDIIRWAEPVYRAFIAGCWFIFWTKDTLYWVAKPHVNVERGSFGRRLHRGDGPALECDLEDLYFWHGVLVGARAILRPHELTVEEVAAEYNAETRRVLIERMGAGRFLELARAEQVDVDSHRHNGMRALFRTEIREPQGWLVCACPSTGRTYFMEVAPDMKSCEEAAKYLDGPALEGVRLVGAT